MVCGASHSRGWSGSLQAAPLPAVSLPHLRGLGSQPVVCPQTPCHSESLSPGASPTQHQTLFLQVRWWFGCAALDLFSSRGGEGKGGVGSLVLGRGPCWQRPQTLSHFLPFPRVTSNRIFLLHTLLTRSCLRPPTAPHTHRWRGPGLGRGETSAQRKPVEGQADTSGLQEREVMRPWGPSRSFWSLPPLCPGLPPPRTGRAPAAFVPGEPLGGLPSQDQVPALPVSLGAICFGDSQAEAENSLQALTLAGLWVLLAGS